MLQKPLLDEQYKEGEWVWVWHSGLKVPVYSLVLKVHENTRVTLNSDKIFLVTYELLFGDVIKRVMRHQMYKKYEDAMHVMKKSQLIVQNHDF